MAFVLFLAGAAALSGDSRGGGGLLILVAIAAFVGVFAIANRPQVVAAPSQPRAAPPRRLAIVDSWHSVASGCGDMAGAFEDRFVAALKAASGDPRLGVSAERERITYRTGNGYEERQRLVVARNQAVVLIDIHPAGDDLYAGWQGYLNWAQWIESAPVSVRIEEGLSRQFRALAPGLYRPNELDLVDLNCIADLVHRGLRGELERVLKEREIDEEIDFEIVRGDRQRAFDAGRHTGELVDPDARGNTWTHLMQSMGSWRSAGSDRPLAASIEAVDAAPSYGVAQRIVASPSFRVTVALAVVCLVMNFLLPTFASTENFFNISRNFAFIGIMALGMTAVIATGGIDLSVGSIMGLTAVASGLILEAGYSAEVAVLVGLATGAFVGLINGLIIVYVGLSPFLTTLGMLSIARSCAVVLFGQSDDLQIWSRRSGVQAAGQRFARHWIQPATELPLVDPHPADLFVLRRLQDDQLGPPRARDWPQRAGAASKSSGQLDQGAGLCRLRPLRVFGSHSGRQLDGVGDQRARRVIGGAKLMGGEASAYSAFIGAALIFVIRNSLLMADVDSSWQGTFRGPVPHSGHPPRKGLGRETRVSPSGLRQSGGVRVC